MIYPLIQVAILCSKLGWMKSAAKLTILCKCLSTALDVAEWAKPFVSKVLAQSAGDAFMTAVAALEFMRLHDGQEESHEPAVRPSDDSDKDDSENDEDGPEEDLDEAGQGWLQDQGFDTREC